MATTESKVIFLELMQALNALADIHGIDVHLSARDVPQSAEGDADIRLQKIGDFAWFQTWLQENPTRASKLIGNWVAVCDHKVVSSGPSEKVTRAAAAERLECQEADVLVIPINVSQSEQYWENLQAELDLCD